MTVSGDIGLRRPEMRFIRLILFLLLAFTTLASAESSNDLPFVVPSVGSLKDLNSSNSSQPGAAVVSTTATDTNFTSATNPSGQPAVKDFKATLATARYLENSRQPERAEPMLVGLLVEEVPEAIQKSALFELGAVVRQENDLPRAQTIYAQFLNRWPSDVKVPEIFLRQGEIFRQMGLSDLALGKFYSVMTSALALKNDQLDYYQSLVLQTQIEIAETHYLMGRFADAADFYSRLLQKSDSALNRPQIQFRLIRSLAIIGHNDEVVGSAQDFLSRYAEADQAPEVRYYFADALKALGRNNEALQQVLLCLQGQKIKNKNNPEVWAYWQQRVGNEIGNQLYREGDYIKALEVYMNLAQLDPSPKWQVPVDYQMGMTYEKLLQPQKAVDTYNQIIARETETGTNVTPGLKTVFDMARWRIGFIKWQANAEAVDHSLVQSAIAAGNSNPKPTSKNE